MTDTAKRLKRAFSLVEVILAVSVFTFAMVAIIGLLGNILQGQQSINNRDEAIGLTSTLEDQLRIQKFSDVYAWVQGNINTHIYIYNYRGNVSNVDVNGLPQPVTDTASIAYKKGQYTLIPSLRVYTGVADSRLNNELAAREGALYEVVLKVSNANVVPQIDLSPDPSNYQEAMLAVQASFYVVPGVGVAVDKKKIPTHTISIAYLR